MAKVKPIPEGYHTITPYLYITGASKAIDWYKRAFGAEEMVRMDGPNGTIGHAEIKIGDSMVMLADASDRSPQARGGPTTGFVLYVNDVDAAFKKAMDLGGKQVQPLEDKFYGDRMGTLSDPFGHEWSLGTHIEDVSPEEMQKRMAAMPAMSSS